MKKIKNIDFKELRKDFPVLKTKEVNKDLIYFDNAATSLKPIQVIKNINKYYKKMPVNIHRGDYKLSQKVSIIYENSKSKICDFVNCNSPKEVIYTQNSTDSINLVMYSLDNSNYFKKGDEILISIAEHHANLVAWQYLAKKKDLILKYVNLKKDFTLDLEDLKSKLSNKTKLLAITHISNTVGFIAPIKKISNILKKYKDCLFLVDGSQSAPHRKIDFKEFGCDFFVFTAHKMLGPTGLGCLIAKEKILKKIDPYRFGGDMISDVNKRRSLWNDLPFKFEAGTPNIAGVFGLASAIDYLENIGLESIHKRDSNLLEYALDCLEKIPDLNIYNPKDITKQAPIVLFDLKDLDCRTLSTLLDESANIATRAGVHCAQPIISKINKNGLTRASFYFYNTFEEIDIFIKTLKKINKI